MDMLSQDHIYHEGERGVYLDRIRKERKKTQRENLTEKQQRGGC